MFKTTGHLSRCTGCTVYCGTSLTPLSLLVATFLLSQHLRLLQSPSIPNERGWTWTIPRRPYHGIGTIQREFRDQGLQDQHPIDQFSGRPWLRRGSIIVLQLSQFCLSHTHPWSSLQTTSDLCLSSFTDERPGAFIHSWFAQEPLISRSWFVTLWCVVLGALGISLEVVLVISRDNGGAS